MHVRAVTPTAVYMMLSNWCVNDRKCLCGWDWQCFRGNLYSFAFVTFEQYLLLALLGSAIEFYLRFGFECGYIQRSWTEAAVLNNYYLSCSFLYQEHCKQIGIVSGLRVSWPYIWSSACLCSGLPAVHRAGTRSRTSPSGARSATTPRYVCSSQLLWL